MSLEEIISLYNQYSKTKAGIFELGHRSWIELTGENRSTFLHNFCTADVTGLEIGKATELFILDSRGKTLAFGHLFAFTDRLIITTAISDHADSLTQHLDKYIIREKVQIRNLSEDRQFFFVTGQSQSEFAELLALEQNACNLISFNNKVFEVGHIELAGWGTLVCGQAEDLDWLKHQMAEQDLQIFPKQLFEVLRVEAGIPAYGKEINESNLPQEMRRDEITISFTKGCYLGQETVAKIDAFGHVNKFLAGIQFSDVIETDLPAEIRSADKKVGSLHSLVHSPSAECWLGLGFVKCSLAEPGTKLTVNGQEAKVVSLPTQKKPD